MKKTAMKTLVIILAVFIMIGALPFSASAVPVGYSLWIGDTQVTAANLNDIPSVTDGKASFDPATNTLTLENVKTIFGKTNDAAIVTRLDHLRIVLKGQNNLLYYYSKSTGSNIHEYRSYGIFARGGITLIDGGEGSLFLKGFASPIRAKDESVTVESGNIEIRMIGPEILGSSGTPCAIDCGDMTVNGGRIEIDARYDAANSIDIFYGHGGAGMETEYYYGNAVAADSFLMTDGVFIASSFKNGIFSRGKTIITGGSLTFTDGDDSAVNSLGEIEISGMTTRVQAESDPVAMYSKVAINIANNLTIASPEGGYIGTAYDKPAIVNSDGSPAKTVLIEPKNETEVDVVDITAAPPEEGDSVQDFLSSVSVPAGAPYSLDDIRLGVIVNGEYEWNTTAPFEAGKVYVLSLCVNAGEGLTLLGGGTDTAPTYEERFHAFLNGADITDFAAKNYPAAACYIDYRFTVGGTCMVTVVCGGYGDDIVVGVPKEANFFEALLDACVFDVLDSRETEDYIFRDLATKPLSEFADEEEFSDDTWALLDTITASDMTVYACFYQKIKNVSLTLTRPVPGTEVTVIDGVQSPNPVVILPDNAHCYADCVPEWYVKDENEWNVLFEGAFEEDKTYYTELLISPDFGYWLDENTVFTVDGATVEEYYGRMSMLVSLSTQAVVPILGDADGDGEVTIIDATWVLRSLAQIAVPYPDEVMMNGDVDGDGELAVIDATFIQRFCAFIQTPYSIGEPK